MTNTLCTKKVSRISHVSEGGKDTVTVSTGSSSAQLRVALLASFNLDVRPRAMTYTRARSMAPVNPLYKLSEPPAINGFCLPILGGTPATGLVGSSNNGSRGELTAGWLSSSGLSTRAVRPTLFGQTVIGLSNTVGSSTASDASTDLDMPVPPSQSRTGGSRRRGSRGKASRSRDEISQLTSGIGQLTASLTGGGASRAATVPDARQSPPLGASASDMAPGAPGLSATTCLTGFGGTTTAVASTLLSSDQRAAALRASTASAAAPRTKKSASVAVGAAARYAMEMAARAEAARARVAQAAEGQRAAAAAHMAKRAIKQQQQQLLQQAQEQAQQQQEQTGNVGAPAASASAPSLRKAAPRSNDGACATGGCAHVHADTHGKVEEMEGAEEAEERLGSPKEVTSPLVQKVKATPPKRPKIVSQHQSAVAAEKAAAEKMAAAREAAKNGPPSPEAREKAAAAALRAAQRLNAADALVLPVEVYLERAGGGGGYVGHESRHSSSERMDALDKATSLSFVMEKGQVEQALPSSFSKAEPGSALTARLTSNSGSAVLGHLQVGGAKVSFALYEANRPPAAAEVLTSGPSSKFLEAVKGLSLSVPAARSAFSGSGPSGAFVSHPLDGTPCARVTVVDAESAVAIEASVECKRLRAVCRRATVAEVRRAEAYEQLRDAEGKTNYDLLHGRIVAARARGVESKRLDQAQTRLKQLQPDTASKEELVAALRWENVTWDEAHATGDTTGLIACKEEGCTVSDDLPGAVLQFDTNAAEMAMKRLKKDVYDGSVSADRWLFERISDAAAAAAAEGGVWRSGGKFILSAITRNQSPVALNRYLHSIGQKGCADGIDALVKWTESHFDKHVSAVQINIHIDSSSFHAQHRDIYGLEQRDMAGRDCTCSFKPNIATACLSMGSTRRCLTEAEVDDFSEKKSCGENCKGYHCSHWLRSGSMMFFNDVWNKSHTHGIPQNAGDADETGRGGPRISVALLCAAADEDPLGSVCAFKPKNIYSTLVDKQQEAKLLKLGIGPI